MVVTGTFVTYISFRAIFALAMTLNILQQFLS